MLSSWAPAWIFLGTAAQLVTALLLGRVLEVQSHRGKGLDFFAIADEVLGPVGGRLYGLFCRAEWFLVSVFFYVFLTPS